MSRTATPWSSLGLIAAAVTTIALVAALGPSAAVAPLPGGRLGPLPPYGAALHPSATLVTTLLAAAVLAGCGGLLGALRALRRGWAPPPGRLIGAGLFAVTMLAVLSPVGSADPKSYAAYGRIAVTGHDPYATTPGELAQAGDPVAAAVEPPWRRSPSVYGPLATAEQAVVAKVAGRSTRAAVGLLGLLGAAAVAGTALLLARLAGTPERRRRVALLWVLNPLVLLQVVAGAHLDALVALGVVAALAAGPGLLGGIGAGAAVAVKMPGAAVAAGLCWAGRRAPRRLAGVLAGLVAVLVPAYVLAGPHAFDQLRKAARFVSLATPWRPLTDLLDAQYGEVSSRRLIGLAALAVAIALAALLARGLPSGPAGARATLVVVLGYTLAAPYALPWYDAVPWALLGLLAASAYDGLLAAHTTVLSLAYLPGRDIALPTALAELTGRVRADLAPWLLFAIVMATIWLSLHRRARADMTVVVRPG